VLSLLSVFGVAELCAEERLELAFSPPLDVQKQKKKSEEDSSQ